MKHCPYCAEEIQEDAIVCKHCGRDLKFASTSFPQAWEAEAKALALKGEVIPAIKKVREASGLGLKEAKDIVDGWRKDSPSAARAKSGGCGVAVIAVILVLAGIVALVLMR